MFRSIVFILCVLGASLALAQEYKPKPGETVMKLTVERRGDVYILLHTKQAPKTTAQIIKLATSGFYNGQKWFKVLKDPRPFLIQFGDPGSKTKPMDDASLGNGGSGTKVAYEDTGKKNVTGAVGLANKEGDRDSGDSQFYILLGDYGFLDGKYTVFGQVASGMNVVRGIKLGDKVTSVVILRG